MIFKVFTVVTFLAFTNAGFLPFDSLDSLYSKSTLVASGIYGNSDQTVRDGHAAVPVVAQGNSVPAHEAKYNTYPKYKFKYGVQDEHTGDLKYHQEIRDGDTVRGSYSFLESDGTTRIVDYSVDGHKGFNAVVHRSVHAVHPVYLSQNTYVGNHGFRTM